jgi:hypothetical protein
LPKVRKRKKDQEHAIESYANKSSDSLKRTKQGRICISLFPEELAHIKILAEQDGRSISSFIRAKIIRIIDDSK